MKEMSQKHSFGKSISDNGRTGNEERAYGLRYLWRLVERYEAYGQGWRRQAVRRHAGLSAGRWVDGILFTDFEYGVSERRAFAEQGKALHEYYL